MLFLNYSIKIYKYLDIFLFVSIILCTFAP